MISSGRLHLSAAGPAALDAMSWLGSALAPEWSEADLLPHIESGCGVLISDSENAPVGLAVVLLDSPSPTSACIPFLGIDPTRRFRGLGGEAGLALERHLRSQLGLEHFYTPVPDGRGLAVYFWLRLGYRPLLTSEQPEPLVGLTSDPVRGIWMMRDQA
jgi:hypothetical protein